eukprot:64517-Pleurochrysis_carterae.AAC.1
MPHAQQRQLEVRRRRAVPRVDAPWPRVTGFQVEVRLRANVFRACSACRIACKRNGMTVRGAPEEASSWNLGSDRCCQPEFVQKAWLNKLDDPIACIDETPFLLKA